ncbi:hypothetical protein HRR83_008471 [Exophiala dermatitidis]|uniref:Dynamin-binding protein n=1 Tax=Exophiala dermatitidis TaxID=5970 RepID=A0AAN6EL61_EXODE|nr:hypothetical protein HRR73_008286 [Exophiala dermatitidis]KAJ4506458.1 hypothetical protein HRR74_008356 [Exophiala dermatitidis]KAJ4533635.1 hypothetical protein HRR77_008396 [Exophiala dermatitidis]KAJ4539321.1 hypothetical protein HRR78_007801 [Exophiala dermatitidis]KAJ4547432.1 hypothetical protein HRR76_000075 [Exophiala dermatitidis]
MPSAVSNQDTHNASHRRQSSRSQTNLADLNINSPSQVQTPDRSLAFLPSTTYTQPQPAVQRSRTPSAPTASNPNGKSDKARDEDASLDPHEFYRQYQDPFSGSSPASLHQEAIRTTTFETEDDTPATGRKSSFASSQSNDDRSTRSGRDSLGSRKLSLNTQHHPNTSWSTNQAATSPSVPNAFRARKASFKDLVARFDASSEEVPPLPTHPILRPGSSTASSSPYTPMGTVRSYGNGLRAGPRTHESRRAGNASLPGMSTQNNDKINHQSTKSTSGRLTQVTSNPEVPGASRKLLFGEVVPTASTLPAAGYGIITAHRRRGSEGSPLHSPNPMPPNDREVPAQGGSRLYGQVPGQSNTELQTSRAAIPQHRRANSDFAGPPARTMYLKGQTASPVNLTGGREQPSAQSRIPISTRHQRIASDSAASSPIDRLGSTSQLPLRLHEAGQSMAKPPPSEGHKFPSPGRRPRSPAKIKSPGKRGRGMPGTPGNKSPSLRANIIAPPPKISPPLRSSRPRLPVSAATTAASRAKMAEKFEIMAKQQTDKKAFRRQRPPELTDIDLKARRLRITQALSRSKEGEDLNDRKGGVRGSSTSRTNSMSASVEGADKLDKVISGQQEIPAVVVNNPAMDTSEEDAFYASGNRPAQEQRAFTLNALKVVEGNSRHPGDDMDSPTLGRAETTLDDIPFSLDTHLLPPVQSEQDPYSAVTQGTEKTDATDATMIDMEPEEGLRAENRGQSLLDQISTLRSQTSSPPLALGARASSRQSDHADEMSVNLMLRETTYLDDEEAAEKGYRPFLSTMDAVLERRSSTGRSSWASSIGNQHEAEADQTPAADANLAPSDVQGERSVDRASSSLSDHSSIEDDSGGETEAYDTYTIVNIVLQQQTPSGVVDQQLVDGIYHRIIQASPDLADAEHVDAAKVRRLCLQELEDYHSHWELSEDSRSHSEQGHMDQSGEAEGELTDGKGDNAGNMTGILVQSHAASTTAHLPQSYRTHKYKSSLDSAADFADTSPSVGNWLQFALHSPDGTQTQGLAPSFVRERDDSDKPTSTDVHQDQNDRRDGEVGSGVSRLPVEDSVDIPRPPSHSPPPPPVAAMPSIEQISTSSQPGIRPATSQTVPLPRPLTAMSQVSVRSSSEPQLVPSGSSGTRPSVEENTPEQRRLNKRRHILKELVDTEYTYERDMRVLCDIYKQTAVAAISDEDTKIIFGNVEHVQQFSKDFLGLLKQVVKPAYVMERSDRRKDANRISTVQSSSASISSVMADMTDAEKDELTRVGQAFEASMSDMEKVYTEYIRTRHAANKRLEALQSSSAVREWLKECSENSTDITNAWSLDALLVKPIQRITKYPLLLNQLLESTPDTHPDASFLRRAAVEITEVNVRINEVKKHTELVDQVLNRKRKESDVRNGLTKAFGRRAEKLRQHVGINEMYEDQEYTELKVKYDNNIAHLYLVARDCQLYIEAIKKFVGDMCDLAAAAEAWVDVGHTSYPQAESKLRQLAIVIRGINSIGLPDHVNQVTRRVLEPMQKTADMLVKFKDDSKGLIQKRDKRLLDYNQFKNKKDRGEKLDKKMTERMEQWEALNLEAKERMRRLIRSTADLVNSCQGCLVQIHLAWQDLVKRKLSAAMEIDTDKLDEADIIREWQEDFDYHEAAALTLSICNGSLLAEAVNMVSFLTPGSTLASDDSPRQPSWNSMTKRSVSGSEEFHQYSLGEQQFRTSGGPLGFQPDDPSDRSSFTFVNGRIRATSATSGRLPRTPEMASRGFAGSVHTANSTNVSRPGTSPGQPQDPLGSTPRLSLEAPSPSLGPIIPESPMDTRHASTSTFYSAAAGPSQSQPNLSHPNGASIFSMTPPRGCDSDELGGREPGNGRREPGVLFTAASVYEFNIDRSRQQGGFRYLTYVTGEIFDVIAEQGELWLAINQDDPTREIGWIWNKHFTKLTD